MILQNYWAWRKQTQISTVSTSISTVGITDITGTAVTTLFSSSSSGAVLALNRTLEVDSTASLHCIFGSGDTTPTALDYSLDTDESSNLTVVETNTQNYASDKLEIIFVCSITNTSADSITLNEVGVVKRVCTTNSSTYADMLFAHEVLSNPVTIAAGETKTINYTWTMQ